MNRVHLTVMLGIALSASQVQAAGEATQAAGEQVQTARAAEEALDVEGECRSIAQADLSGCRCQGLYFESKFGLDEGAAALHLVGRSYVPEPQVSAAALYERFGADRLNRVAHKILATRDEVVSYCPFSAHVAD